MTRFEELKSEYKKSIFESLKNNKLIIEAFVAFFGEKYRDLITYQINHNISYCPFINWDDVDTLLKMENDSIAKEQAKELKEAFEVYSLIYKMDRLKTPDFSDNVFEVLTTLDEIDGIQFAKNDVTREIASFVSYPKDGCMTFVVKNQKGEYQEHSLIVFQGLFEITRFFIHELSHFFVCHYIAKGDDFAVFKTGSITEVQGEDKESNRYTNFDELINEKCTEEVTRFFKALGGHLSFTIDDEGFVKSSIYDKRLYLVEQFYMNFKEWIKESRISENGNELIKRIGRENFESFVDLINEAWDVEDELEKVRYKKEIGKLINKMVEHAKKASEYTTDELESFYQELESQGLRVRKLK